MSDGRHIHMLSSLMHTDIAGFWSEGQFHDFTACYCVYIAYSFGNIENMGW